MKYAVVREKDNKTVKEIIEIDGFSLPSKNKFVINNTKINYIKLSNKNLAYPFVSKYVFNKYNRLIKKLTDLLVSDDEDGTATFQIIQSIEQFRQEIKNNYRKYLKKKDLEEMAAKLKFINDTAKKREKDIYYSYMNDKTNNRSK